jgi:allantoin racemase
MQQKTIAILGSGDAAVVDNNMPMPPPLALSNIHAQVLAVPNAVFPATAADREICEEAYFEAGLRAAAAGADALYINTVGDYGHAMLRDAVRIPVGGAGCGAFSVALTTAEHFAVVTLWPPAMRFIYDAVLTEMNLQQHCDDIVHLTDDTLLTLEDGPIAAMAEMQSCALTTIDTVADAALSLETRFPGTQVILGCTCMYPLAEPLQARGISVLEPMSAGFRQLASQTLTRH